MSSERRVAQPSLRSAVGLALLLAAAGLGAQEPPSSEGGQEVPGGAPQPPRAAPWQLNGVVSLGYTFDLRRPRSGRISYRTFDYEHDTLRLDVVELVLQRPVQERGDVGFRADLTAGTTVPRVTAASGLFRDPYTGAAEDFDLQQAYVSWIAPLGRGLRLEAGKFVNPLGYEAIDGYDTLNEQLSRSFFFPQSPFTLTGLKASYGPCAGLTATLFAVAGWDNVRDNNRRRSFGGQVAWAPHAKWSFSGGYLGGPEQNDSDEPHRHLVDLVAVFKPGGGWSLAANADWVSEAEAAGPSHTGRWRAVALYARRQFGPAAAGLRAELFDDPHGLRTGTPQTLWGWTATAERRLAEMLLVRGEIRLDRSDRAVFEDHRGTLRRSTVTLAAGAAFTF